MLRRVEGQTDWLKPLCILALVFGVGGMCCDLSGLASLLATDTISGMAGEQARAALEAQRPFRPWLMVLAVLQIAQSFALALGGGLSLRDVRRHGSILRASLIAGLILTPLSFTLGLVTQLAARKVPQPGFPEGFGSAMVGFAMVLGGGWALGKMAFFFVTLRVLKPQRDSGTEAPAPP
jgi:hypothetical protein